MSLRILIELIGLFALNSQSRECLYFILCDREEGYEAVKIGRSVDPRQRRQKLGLKHCPLIVCEYCGPLEKFFHEMFSQYRIRGDRADEFPTIDYSKSTEFFQAGHGIRSFVHAMRCRIDSGDFGDLLYMIP